MRSVKKNKLKYPIVLLGTFFALLVALVILQRKETAIAQGGEETTTHLPIIAKGLAFEDWPMVAANPQRTSWTATEVTNVRQIQWYRPIEAYIPQNVQLIGAHGNIYVATARGVYALNAYDGSVSWRFDTELPIGNSPTINNGVLYVGGYDKKLHALNAITGQHLWSFDGANAGYDTNPLVVSNIVYIGNRDGTMYAIGAHGTPNQGQLIWQYQTGGPIHNSAAYADGTVYFVANDNFAYALNADNGNLVWRSNRLPGDGYHSYWPVIYRDKVIFAAASGYDTAMPGLRSVGYGKYQDLERDEIFGNASDGTLIGPAVTGQSWAHGKTVLDGSRITNYHEDKPWRRVLIVLNRSNGSEYTFDSDGDGRAEYIPATFWGTQSGNRYPPIVGPDDILYFNNMYQKFYIPQGKVMGWQMGTHYLSQVGGQGAIDEPQAISAGGEFIYRNLCCDRVGDFFGITQNFYRTLWNYGNPLVNQAPGYDDMWFIFGDPTIRLKGWYRGNTNSINAAYHNHGDQNAIIPYANRLIVHRSNAIIAYGPESGPGALPMLSIQNVQDNPVIHSTSELTNQLEAEIQKILDAGLLKPGYYNVSSFQVQGMKTYFENPGDMLFTLALAYPHLSSSNQAEVRTYMQTVFNRYFDDEMYARTGWADGVNRTDLALPPEVINDMATLGPAYGAESGVSWQYPPHNFYSLWKYAQIISGDTITAYDLAKSKLIVPVPSIATNEYFREKPYELNAWIAGYEGYLKLQDLANTDNYQRTAVQNELNRLKTLRVNIFTKDSYHTTESGYFKKPIDISRNFIFLVPELADHLQTYNLTQVQQALNEYEAIAPYWFVSRFESSLGEGTMFNLYSYNSLLMAKALILDESREEIAKYLDVPAFARGDLFYIQNLVLAIEAPSSAANHR